MVEILIPLVFSCNIPIIKMVVFIKRDFPFKLQVFLKQINDNNNCVDFMINWKEQK